MASTQSPPTSPPSGPTTPTRCGALFTDDAELVSAAGTFSGRDAIVGFYRDLAFTVDDLWPDPGPLIVDGDRVAVEIRLRMGGTTTLVGDVFTLSDGRIARWRSTPARSSPIRRHGHEHGIAPQRGHPDS